MLVESKLKKVYDNEIKKYNRNLIKLARRSLKSKKKIIQRKYIERNAFV